MIASATAVGMVLATALATRWSLTDRTGRRVHERLASSATEGRGTRVRCPLAVTERLLDAGVETAPDQVWRAAIASVTCGFVAALVVGGPGFAGIALLVFAVVGAAWLHGAASRGRDRFDAGIPQFLDAVARGLRSGASLVDAIDAGAGVVSGRLAADLRWVSAASKQSGVVAALGAWIERRPTSGVRLVASALCLGAETGGAQARAVDGLATTLRQRHATATEVRALSSQARASAVVIAVAPLAFGAFAAVTDPRTSAFLLRTPIGLTLLSIGLGLDALAAVWMSRITRSVG